MLNKILSFTFAFVLITALNLYEAPIAFQGLIYGISFLSVFLYRHLNKLPNKAVIISLFLGCSIAYLNCYFHSTLLKPEVLSSNKKETCLKGVVTNQPISSGFSSHKFVLQNSQFGKGLIQLHSASLIPAVADTITICGRVKAFKDKKGFSEKQYFKSQNIFYKLSSAKVKEFHSERSLTSSFYKLTSLLQSNLSKVHLHFLNNEQFTTIQKMLLGRGSPNKLNEDLSVNAKTLGLSHVFAASGFHLTTVALLIYGFLGLFRLRKKVRLITVLALISLYATAAAWSPSITRAWLMATFLIIAKLNNRQTNLLKILCYSAIVSLLFNPNAIQDLGFQFSYLAVLGIILFTDKLVSKMSFIPRSWAGVIAIPLTAQCLILPLQLLYFKSIPIYFFLSNLLLVPVAALILQIALLGSFLSLLGSLGWFLASGSELLLAKLTTFFTNSISYLSLLPAASIKFYSVSVLWVCWFYILIFTVAYFRKNKVALHFACASLLPIFSLQLFAPKYLQIYSISHKSYEALLITTPEKHKIFICNKSVYRLHPNETKQELLDKNIKKIDWWIGNCAAPEGLEVARTIQNTETVSKEVTTENLLIKYNKGAVLVKYKEITSLFLFKASSTKNNEAFYTLIKHGYSGIKSAKNIIWSKTPKAQICLTPYLSKTQRSIVAKQLSAKCKETFNYLYLANNQRYLRSDGVKFMELKES
ncbi:MAG TPA: ComEC/Rec2 family competence protein [Vampirovibrionales bacterium]